MINELGRDVEGSDPGLLLGSILEFSWSDRGNSQNPVRTADVRGEISTKDLPTTTLTFNGNSVVYICCCWMLYPSY